MMSAVLIKYWLRYRGKKKKKRKREKKKKLVAIRVTDLCKSFLRFFGLSWFMNYSDINRQYANSRHTRVRRRAHTCACMQHTHTHTAHTHTPLPKQRGKSGLAATILGQTLELTYLTTFLS